LIDSSFILRVQRKQKKPPFRAAFFVSISF
jgi:hypothetical protein